MPAVHRQQVGSFMNRVQIRLLNSKTTDLHWHYSRHNQKPKLPIVTYYSCPLWTPPIPPSFQKCKQALRHIQTERKRRRKRKLFLMFENFSLILFAFAINIAIHMAAGLTVPGHSMILPGTIPESPISHEWSRRQERVSEVVPTGRTPGRQLCK